ncbi:MAG: hypothetical protein ED556_00975 [Winogradskyella sp.]|uniref:hypothetical protein n=1 Tax=Winogradskyella sp. TaxID=1883156 RepID=UPI000F3DDF36|nr:hypothetical protein [Winogradskyella sp.]RNC87793.1 MAG: hypothetical protein ED556_00975 [Winogradskyella sp.]
MRNLHFFRIVIITLFIFSCESDDNTGNPIAENPGVNAVINGGTFNNFEFSDSIYQVTKQATNNTITIDAGDTNGNQITIFLNSSGGFDSGTIKTMGDIDVNNFVTYVLIRQSNPQMSYYSSIGNVTITDNITHPTESGIRLLSGNFEITANPINDPTSTTMTGTFIELEYED